MAKAEPTSILFVDGTNVDHRVRYAFGREDIDFAKLFAEVTAGTTLLHTHYCTAPYVRAANRGRSTKQVADLNYLRTLPNLTVHLGKYQPRQVRCRDCGHTYQTYAEKGTDTYVAAKLVQAACGKAADRLYLLTGDNDLWPAVQICQDEGMEVHVAFVVDPTGPIGPQLQRQAQLRRYAVGYTLLDEALMGRCWRA